jgi:hypothetical protein
MEEEYDDRAWDGVDRLDNDVCITFAFIINLLQ